MSSKRRVIRELLVLVALPGAFYLLLEIWAGFHDGYLSILRSHRAAIYPAIVGLLGSLLGFTIASLTIVIGYTNNPRLEIVRNSRHWPSLFEAFTRSIRWLAATTVVAVITLLFDRDDAPNSLLGGALLMTLLATAVILWRMFWVLERVVRVMVTPGNRPAGT